MKGILFSVQPQHTVNILNGDKTIEVRKTMPQIKLPCKGYIYCTKPKKWYAFSSWGATSNELVWKIKDKVKMCEGFEFWGEDCEKLNGKVVAEFTLKNIVKFDIESLIFMGKEKEFMQKSCLGGLSLRKYLGDKIGYSLGIEDLKIYDKPKELSEFYKNNYKKIIEQLEFDGCEEKHCKYAVANSFLGDDGYCDYSMCPKLRLKRPPQSWCYVESMEETKQYE